MPTGSGSVGAGEWAVEQAFARRDRTQPDAVPGFHFNDERITTVAFHCNAWFDAGRSEKCG
jgi:hypothetical protein